MRKIKVFTAQKWRFPNGGAGRQTDGATEAEHRQKKLIISTF